MFPKIKPNRLVWVSECFSVENIPNKRFGGYCYMGGKLAVIEGYLYHSVGTLTPPHSSPTCDGYSFTGSGSSGISQIGKILVL